MEGCKRGSHTIWDCKYHVVWTTKYRFPVHGGDVGDRCRELIRETELCGNLGDDGVR
ncbi:MAG: transposase [Xanthobacteraceae bacterium]